MRLYNRHFGKETNCLLVLGLLTLQKCCRCQLSSPSKRNNAVLTWENNSNNKYFNDISIAVNFTVSTIYLEEQNRVTSENVQCSQGLMNRKPFCKNPVMNVCKSKYNKHSHD